MTSNPYWNLRARKLTKEEEILLGYPSRGNLSYFAPVIRPNEFAVITGKSYPLHRIQDLIIEFGI